MKTGGGVQGQNKVREAPRYISRKEGEIFGIKKQKTNICAPAWSEWSTTWFNWFKGMRQQQVFPNVVQI
jgi:hypothetical protein